MKKPLHDCCTFLPASGASGSLLLATSSNSHDCLMNGDLGLGLKHKGPAQPKLLKFPLTSSAGQNRAFVRDWYAKFPWIEYSIAADTAFCFPCRHFASRYGNSEPLFTDTGFRSWKYATGKKGNLTMHATSNVHIMACAMWKDYIDSSSTGTVLKMQSKAHRQWVTDNRLYLHRVIDAVIFICRDKACP